MQIPEARNLNIKTLSSLERPALKRGLLGSYLLSGLVELQAANDHDTPAAVAAVLRIYKRMCFSRIHIYANCCMALQCSKEGYLIRPVKPTIAERYTDPRMQCTAGASLSSVARSGSLLHHFLLACMGPNWAGQPGQLLMHGKLSRESLCRVTSAGSACYGRSFHFAVVLCEC